MSRDPKYRPVGHSIVTVPLNPELHRRLRVKAAEEGRTIKWLVTKWIEQGLATPEASHDR